MCVLCEGTRVEAGFLAQVVGPSILTHGHSSLV